MPQQQFQRTSSTSTGQGVAPSVEPDSGYSNASALEAMGLSDPEVGIGTGVGTGTPGVRASTNRYTVRRGDTLSSLARQAGQPGYQDLYDLNRDLIMEQDRIRTGWVLVLPEGWALPGMTSDPNNLAGDPLALADTEYAEAELGMGVQVGADGTQTQVETFTAGETVAGNRSVRVLRDWSNPITYVGDATPAESELFVEDATGEAITTQQGSVRQPEVFRSAEPDAIYIGGQPAAADVNQGGIGDCFFLAAVLGVVNTDPQTIMDMISFSGQRATITFFRKDAGGGYVPVTVTVTDDLLVKSSDTQDLKGSDVRVASTPTGVDWTADVYGDELSITKSERFEWALWGPLLEKAYARFAEQYGKYGDAAAQPAGSGYTEIDGGKSRLVYPIFYGSEVSNLDADQIAYDPTSDNIGPNMEVLRQFVSFTENREHPGDAGGDQTFLQLKIGDKGAIERCLSMVDAVLAAHDPWFWEPDALTPALDSLRAAIVAWQADETDANRQVIIDEATALSAPGAFPELWDDSEADVYGDLNEVLGIVVNIGSDNSPGRRNVYSSHAYNVLDVHWAFAMGLPIEVTSANIDTVAPLLDLEGTTVEIQNPHATNEPDLDGNGPDGDAVDDGRFTMTLEAVMRNFGWTEVTTVTHAPTP